MATTRELPWVEKYRPHELGGIVGHDSALGTIRKFIEKDCLPHLLFYGPPGTGKTTTAVAIARELYGQEYARQVIELNASDDRGINVVRERIKGFASSRALFSTKHKLIILDESDAMTSAAQAAMRRVMEQYTQNVRFIMICNYPERLISALRSRCTEFRFSPITTDAARHFLETIVSAEGLSVSDDGYDALIRLGVGDMRRSINLLQTTSLSASEITESTVYLCAGYPLPTEINSLFVSLSNNTIEGSLADLKQMIRESGHSLLDIIRELHRQFVLHEIKPIAAANFISRLAQIERRISEGANEEVQAAAVVAAFHLLRADLG